MKKLGVIEKVATNNLLLVKITDSKNIPNIGNRVLLPDFRGFGKVMDVIGNVNNPYAVIKPFKKEEDLSKYIGQVLLVDERTFTSRKKK
ncbi:H/ACA RNA-protein complex protein Gar1 [Fervidicoccus fontis]|uniref:H/ACA RNA-protein complex protein Gar1 n=1 Tax=Fervidicoccus fontis TaxID=683846 RepID=A0A843AG54_9CREN|nr:H/ACA RNA-protein complex protein Gar1 [Fervidicoccus fontis]MBE9390599.1 H/ACA RNA-protein complex protein Gar1 [Fervidicoccus fontis]